MGPSRVGIRVRAWLGLFIALMATLGPRGGKRGRKIGQDTTDPGRAGAGKGQGAGRGRVGNTLALGCLPAAS